MLRKFTFLFLAGALGATTACDSTGPNGDARMNVRMSADAGAQLSSVLLSDAVLAPLSADAVDSISIRITGIEVERAQNDSTGGGWVSLSLRDSALTRINLMQLPSSDSASWMLARGDIPAGTYKGLRIRFDVATATITLNDTVTVGQQTWLPGTYPLEVPSGEQNGIKVPFTSITIGEDATADAMLKFDATTTVHTVATGSGVLKMSPVLRSSVKVEGE